MHLIFLNFGFGCERDWVGLKSLSEPKKMNTPPLMVVVPGNMDDIVFCLTWIDWEVKLINRNMRMEG